jgi:hypothetical protein
MDAQELYPSSEPASNMAAHSIGLRLKGEYDPQQNYFINPGNDRTSFYRLNSEIMWGAGKKWMLHLDLFAGNTFADALKFNGASVYAKYRFFSNDEVRSHFRMAAYGRISKIDSPIISDEINLSGDNSGCGGGIVATQLLHKIALSFTGGYLKAGDNVSDKLMDERADALNYSFSAGYLFLPFHYHDYSQPNLNLYAEFIGKTNLNSGKNYIDIAPALQLILNSIMRIDFIYEQQLQGNMLRMSEKFFALRIEYNLLNAY